MMIVGSRVLTLVRPIRDPVTMMTSESSVVGVVCASCANALVLSVAKTVRQVAPRSAALVIDDATFVSLYADPLRLISPSGREPE